MSGVDSGDYLGDWCAGTLTNRGTEWDWLRILWDLETAEGVSTSTIFDIYDDADPDTWNATGDTSGSNDPAIRLLSAASSNGVLTEWETGWTVDGVHR